MIKSCQTKLEVKVVKINKLIKLGKVKKKKRKFIPWDRKIKGLENESPERFFEKKNKKENSTNKTG